MNIKLRRDNCTNPRARQCLPVLARERGVRLGMTFLEGTSVRAHQKAAGAAAQGATRRDAARVRRSAAPVAAMAPRP